MPRMRRAATTRRRASHAVCSPVKRCAQSLARACAERSARDPGELLALMVAALRDIDALARVMAYPRTRLAPMLIVRPPHDCLRALAAPRPCAINSS